MRVGAIFMTILGIGVAGGSVYLAREYIERGQNRVASPSVQSEVVDVIVARQDIAFGQALEAHMLNTIAWPRDAVPNGVFSDAQLLLPERGGEPRRAKRAISQGELILNNKVSDFGEKVTIVQTLTKGQRAMAIKVSAETAVGGFVTPGDHVDVVLTQGRDNNLRAVTILQHIKVVGVDQQADEQSDAPEIARTVTVAVTAEQGQRLALAQKAGTLSLTLRNLDSQVSEKLSLIKLSDILQDAPLEEKVAKRQIVVRRGNERQVEEIN